MGASAADSPTAPVGTSRRTSDGFSIRGYFFSDPKRTGQTLLGLVWALDAGLQFQSFMYSNGFVQMIKGMTAGQPSWISDSMNWAANTAGGNLAALEHAVRRWRRSSSRSGSSSARR